MAGPVADGLDRMAMTLGKVPEVAGAVVVDLARTLGSEHHRLAATVNDKGPFVGQRMPVQLAGGAGIEEHVDAGDAAGDREKRRTVTCLAQPPVVTVGAEASSAKRKEGKAPDTSAVIPHLLA